MENKIERTIKALNKHGFDAVYVKDRNEARDLILKFAEGRKKIGVGGSSSVRALDVLGELKKRKHRMLDHWAAKDLKKILSIRKAQMTSDLFLTSANAVTMTGEIINREGVGNRTNSMTFGPGKVVIVVGKNKIVSNAASGMVRIKNIAAPKRARELNVGTPCVKTGVCTECNSPARICRVTVVMERKPALTDITVIIVGEDLGN